MKCDVDISSVCWVWGCAGVCFEYKRVRPLSRLFECVQMSRLGLINIHIRILGQRRIFSSRIISTLRLYIQAEQQAKARSLGGCCIVYGVYGVRAPTLPLPTPAHGSVSAFHVSINPFKHILESNPLRCLPKSLMCVRTTTHTFRWMFYRTRKSLSFGMFSIWPACCIAEAGGWNLVGHGTECDKYDDHRSDSDKYHSKLLI